jgi:hypothetical protein
MKPRPANVHQQVRGAYPGTLRSAALRRAAATGSFVAMLAAAAVSGGVARADGEEPHAGAATAAAQAAPGGMSPEEIEREAEAIARSIMSPFCPGRTVSACPNAGPWRDEIRKWVAEGVDPLEIKQRLGERVPEHNLAGVPKNRLGWVLPVGLGIGAIASLIFLLRFLIGAKTSDASTPKASGADPLAEKTAPDDVGTKAKGAAAGSKANGEDWDARLEEELETLDQ